MRAVREYRRDHVPTAILSRRTAGTRRDWLIVNLPGWPSAIDVCLSWRDLQGDRQPMSCAGLIARRCAAAPGRWARSALRRASRRSDLGSSHRSIRRPRRQRGACRLDESGRQRRPSRKSGARTARLRTLLDIFHFNPKLALHGPLWLNFVNVDDSLGVFAFLHLSCFFRGHATAGPLTARLSNPTSVGP